MTDEINRFAPGLCLGCGYNLFGLAENRCPECGRAFNPQDPSSFGTPGSNLRAIRLTYKLALLCALVPLIAGVSTFGLWILTRARWLEAAGIIIIQVGLVAFLIGAVALGVHACLADRSSSAGAIRRVLACALLLISNFPVAFCIVIAVVHIHTRYTIRVQNTSQQALEAVHVHGGGCDTALGSIPPGASVQYSFHPSREGELKLKYVHGSVAHEQMVDSYVTPPMGGDILVTVQSDGSVNVTDQTR